MTPENQVVMNASVNENDLIAFASLLPTKRIKEAARATKFSAALSLLKSAHSVQLLALMETNGRFKAEALVRSESSPSSCWRVNLEVGPTTLPKRT